MKNIYREDYCPPQVGAITEQKKLKNQTLQNEHFAVMFNVWWDTPNWL